MQWAEDDRCVPAGVGPVGVSGPVTGTTYFMYHGTTSQRAQAILSGGFCRSKGGMLGPGVYLSRDLDKAVRYPIGHPDYDKVILKVVVDVGNVIVINYQNHPLQKTWQYHGYDSAWVPPNCGMVPSGLEESCIWDPSRIRIIEVIRPRRAQPRPAEAADNMWFPMMLLTGVLLLFGITRD